MVLAGLGGGLEAALERLDVAGRGRAGAVVGVGEEGLVEGGEGEGRDGDLAALVLAEEDAPARRVVLWEEGRVRQRRLHGACIAAALVGALLLLPPVKRVDVAFLGIDVEEVGWVDGWDGGEAGWDDAELDDELDEGTWSDVALADDLEEGRLDTGVRKLRGDVHGRCVLSWLEVCKELAATRLGEGH